MILIFIDRLGLHKPFIKPNINERQPNYTCFKYFLIFLFLLKKLVVGSYYRNIISKKAVFSGVLFYF